MSTMNWNDLLNNAADSGGFEPVPAGPYNGKVDRASSKKTSNGKQMYAVMFKIEDGPNKGRTLWTNLVISPESPNALGIFFRHMNALGLDAEYFQTNPGPDQVAKDLVNRRAHLTVSVKQHNGQDKNEITNIAPPTDGQQVTGGGAASSDPLAQSSQTDGNSGSAPNNPPF